MLGRPCCHARRFRCLGVGAIIIVLAAACSLPPDVVTAIGMIAFPSGAFEAETDIACTPHESAEAVTIRTSGVNPFGSRPESEATGQLAGGMLLGDECLVSFAVGPVDELPNMSITIGGYRWNLVDGSFVEEVDDFPEPSHTYRTNGGDDVANVGVLRWDSCTIEGSATTP